MSSVATVRRQLKIKTGSLNRLAKEHKLYVKEAEDQRAKVDKDIEDKAEEWDIKNGRKMLEEALKMITHGQTLLSKAVADLQNVVEAAETEPELKDDADLVKAKEALANVTA